jgi:deoxynucleoside kinase
MTTVGDTSTNSPISSGKPVIVSIDGNIGSGKSTLVEHLRERYEGHPKICFLQEPVEMWNTITSKDGETILSMYYGNQKKYAFAFQMMAYISRLVLLREALKKDYDFIVTERSVFTDKNVFAKMLYDDEKIEEVEYAIYNKWFDEFLADMPTAAIIYVHTDPAVAEERVVKRSREGEAIPLAYLERCHHYHEAWLNYDNVDDTTAMLVLDANTDIVDHPEKIKEWMDEIGAFLGLPTPVDKCDDPCEEGCYRSL